MKVKGLQNCPIVRVKPIMKNGKTVAYKYWFLIFDGEAFNEEYGITWLPNEIRCDKYVEHNFTLMEMASTGKRRPFIQAAYFYVEDIFSKEQLLDDKSLLKFIPDKVCLMYDDTMDCYIGNPMAEFYRLLSGKH
jgi:hypothetical protein